jgi:ribonuclease HI
MPWIQARLHGQPIFARAHDDGSLQIENDHVAVCYGKGADRLYQARPANVVVSEPRSLLPDEACKPGDTVVRSAAKRRAASDSALQAPRNAVIVYADGACSGNPGPAGLGVVVVERKARVDRSEFLGEATNNIAELMAIERALDLLKEPARPAVIYTDSSYAIGVLTKGWKAKANVELVGRVKVRLAKRPATRLVHVPGHAGVELNERADELAREAARTGRTRTERVPAGRGEG